MLGKQTVPNYYYPTMANRVQKLGQVAPLGIALSRGFLLCLARKYLDY